MATKPFTPYSPYRSSPQPVYPTPSMPGGGSGSVWDSEGGGGWDWVKWLGGFFKDHAGDLLNTAGNVAGGYLDYRQSEEGRKQQQQQFEQTLKQRQDEFNRTFGLSQNAQAMDVAGKINRAPLADRGQYMAMNYTPPMPFQPRDYTKGVEQIRGAATGGAQAQLAANAATAANYKSGMGGVDTSTLQLILSRLGLNGTGNGNGTGLTPPAPFRPPTTPTTPTDTTPAAPTDTTGQSLGQIVARTQYEPGFFPQGLPERPSLSLVQQEWKRIYPGQPMPALSSRELIDWWRSYRDAYHARLGGR
jgi:hypothetical protein